MQDIYKQRNNWKIILGIVGGAILVITMLYSNYLAQNLERNELKNAQLYKDALEFMNNNQDLNSDVTIQDYIIENFSQPIIFKDENGLFTPFNFENDSLLTNDQPKLQKMVNEFLASGKTPLKGTGYSSEFYVFNTKLLDYIRYYPYLQIILVGAFIALGYFLFNSTKRAEQNRVWAGMAKETAHQLGTPISAIMGWVSHLKDTYANDTNIQDIGTELERDVEKLNLIADRFSKIGSAPDLINVDLETEVSNVVEYMKRRASKKIEFEINKNGNLQFNSAINSHLFEWVLENLMRNSLDAMEEKGKISIDLYKDEKYNCIDISDTGKGIPSNKFKTVFNPGYSTKQRGWGLGLSLAKRIIEEYHNGKIMVKSSKIDEGTTFTIKLKAVNK